MWFRTTTADGKLIGFGNSRTGPSSSYDRHIFMNNAGQPVFGVHPGAVKTITSPGSYADGKWHHAVDDPACLGIVEPLLHEPNRVRPFRCLSRRAGFSCRVLPAANATPEMLRCCDDR